jgi:glycosyltransferase involved in cell wall biosynthesis
LNLRVAFYAPLKPPTHGTPSGDRRVASLFMDALGQAGSRVELVSTFRSFDGHGDAERQGALRIQGEALGRSLAAQWRAAPQAERPGLWFTYHLYYKAPDWLGPVVSAELGIPYVVAEASYAPKRAEGPWAIGHEASVAAIRHAALIFSPSRDDIGCLKELVPAQRIQHLPPFLDLEPYRLAVAARDAHRARLAASQRLDPAVPWIAVVAMMREGDKLASYHALAATLALLKDLPWRVLVVGDGPARDEVHRALERAAPGRACFLGALRTRDVAHVFAASDLTLWPGVNEAYGMALLEAQAAGLPAVSCALRGVPEVVLDGRTGLLAPTLNEAALAERTRALLVDTARRLALGRAAAAFVATERSLETASQKIGAALAQLAR